MPNVKQNDESQSDRRLRENREQYDKSQEHMTKDGEPDRRYKENRDDQQSNNNDQEHLTKTGEPDHRYKENREDQEKQPKQNDDQDDDDEDDDDDDDDNDADDDDKSSKLADIPTKKDGTADMRYTESREAVASGVVTTDENIEEATNDDDQEQ